MLTLYCGLAILHAVSHGQLPLTNLSTVPLTFHRPLDSQGHKIHPADLGAWLHAQNLVWTCMYRDQEPFMANMIAVITHHADGSVLVGCRLQTTGNQCRFQHTFFLPLTCRALFDTPSQLI